ncbi:BlaI/MecI/CopY family transcriptional regulator [Rhodococcus sp. G-MC3]|uniref:BlaI/MecI/CopY family transcriptional regulator n=1 Tax=Rhodococcus sp. G-MC3 TaxID=3046209 RepID=UPI0024B8C89C|nr:BlaI/MecI/CopY family transcriptional regulator [Rhodococcus sp. G-MC3]MDJ0392923.1 BlaI/MecI/CopY family transcriptional regulator [Rhodococcus sp. G-MC3]
MRRAAGELESAIVSVLSGHDGLSVAEVRSALDETLAHTTVMTALVRLSRKGLLTRERQGRSFVYSLAAPAESLPALKAALRMHTELDSKVARAEVLANFVAALGSEDEATLRELLSSSRSEKPS